MRTTKGATSARRPVRTLAALALAASVALAGCGDDDPSGPGALDGRVSATVDLGAVVLSVEDGDGTAPGTVSGAGDTRAFVGPASAGSRRVILVGEGSGELRFSIDVEDVGAPQPSVTVVSAVDTSNEDVAAVSTIDVQMSIR